MAYPACGGEYFFEGDGEVGDCPRPLEGRQLTVDFVEVRFLHVDLELLLILLALAVGFGVVVAGCWLGWRALTGLADCWLDEVRAGCWLDWWRFDVGFVGLRKLNICWPRKLFLLQHQVLLL